MAFLRKILDAGLRAAAALARSQDGGPASEFAMVAPIFIVLMFGTAQAAIIYLANATSRRRPKTPPVWCSPIRPGR